MPDQILSLPKVSFSGGNNKFHDLGDDNTIESMQLLELDGLVTSTGLGEGQWCLTAAAVEGYIRQSFWLSSPTKLFAPRTDLPLDQCTQVELQILLANNGWEQLSLVEHQDKAHVPFKGGTDSCKNWFSDRNGRFFSAYLVCLLKSEKLFPSWTQGRHFPWPNWIILLRFAGFSWSRPISRANPTLETSTYT